MKWHFPEVSEENKIFASVWKHSLNFRWNIVDSLSWVLGYEAVWRPAQLDIV